MDKLPQSLCVAGGGSWGTALAHLAAGKGLETTLYLRDPAVRDAVNGRRENPRYLPGLRLHPRLRATTEPSALSSPLVLLAVPFQAQRAFLESARSRFGPGLVLVNVAKGLELSSGKTGFQVASEALSGLDFSYAALSGPSFAKEVVEGRPTAVVAAASTPGLAAMVQELLSTPSFRVYASDDLMGVEAGGALKNVIAIAAGLCDGLDVGLNGRAALLTRGLAELSRLGCAMGASPLTFMGLSGLGDLTLTATGSLSRNRRLGLALAAGKSAEEAAREIGMVSEGAKTAFAARELAARLGVSVPVTDAVCAILGGELSPSEAAARLMTRAPARERTA